MRDIALKMWQNIIGRPRFGTPFMKGTKVNFTQMWEEMYPLRTLAVGFLLTTYIYYKLRKISEHLIE